MSKLLFGFFCSSVFVAQVFAKVSYPLFDRGPDLKDPMQSELLEIIRDMPHLPGISTQLQVLVPEYKNGQKMRPDFGAMPVRGFLKPNTISVLVIGQDGTHIAEGANRPGIAGFGGRVQDMLKHFGIFEGVFFTNLFVNTISGQYGSRNTPVLVDGKAIQFRNVIENRQWLMTHGGAYAQWRNRFLGWVIRNNTESLKMVMMLGQAGKDAGSSFVNSLEGGSVQPYQRVGDGSRFSVPVFKMVRAGGNNEWAVPLTLDGKDVVEVLLARENIRQPVRAKFQAELDALLQERKTTANKNAKKALTKKIRIARMRLKAIDEGLDYTDGMRNTGVSTEVAKFTLTQFSEDAKKLMVFSKGGPKRNGVLFPQQFGGWDLNTMTVKGKKTRSIRGLSIPCGTSRAGLCKNRRFVKAPNVVFVGAPHPTFLSFQERDRKGSAAFYVQKDLINPLLEEMGRGWVPPRSENGEKSPFDLGKSYTYGRGLIPPSHGDPGITALRLLPVSTAKRAGSSVIVIGTRNHAEFGEERITAMENDLPSNPELLSTNTVLTGRPKLESMRKKYDRGPSKEYASLLYSLDRTQILREKSKYSGEAQDLINTKITYQETSRQKIEDAYDFAMRELFKKYGIDAFYSKSHTDAGFFGHYRGTFEKPRAIIVADPHGFDSFITSKAATGERGQYLHGLMRDLGYKDKYLVISTVPFAMQGASTEDWQEALAATQSWRESLIAKLRADFPRALWYADGAHAAKAVKPLLGRKRLVKIDVSENFAQDMIHAAESIKKSASGEQVDVPRTHLTWIARTWEGTSGDRVITAKDKLKGQAFAIVAPLWARRNVVHFSESTRRLLEEDLKRLASAGEPLPRETVREFVNRRAGCLSLSEKQAERNSQKAVCELTAPIEFPSHLRAQ